MMTIASVYDLLSVDAGLTALVGTRIYPARVPENPTAPYVVWQRIAAQPFSTHNEATGNQYDLVQFTMFSTTYEEAEAVSLALVAALDNVALSTGDRPTLQQRRDMGWDDVAELYRMDADFLI